MSVATLRRTPFGRPVVPEVYGMLPRGVRAGPFQGACESRQAVQLIAEANTLLQNGQQQQAGEVLSRAAKVSSLDEATNEDARVQLRALKTQQAIVGLKRYGKTLTAHLDDLGALGPRFTVAHGVWLDGDDMRRLGGHGASVARPAETGRQRRGALPAAAD